MQVLLENVRTFVGQRTIPLRPITLLVGENSTGKSTFLAMLSALLSSPGFPFNPAFNEPPYAMGGYDTIATFKGGNYGRAKYFALGMKLEPEDSTLGLRYVYSRYENDQGRPELSRLHVNSGIVEIELEITRRSSASHHGTITIKHQKGTEYANITIPRRLGEQSRYAWQSAIFDAFLGEANGRTRRIMPSEVMDEVFKLEYAFRFERTVSLAPIRTRPERTYSKTSSSFEPAGDHVPYLLDRLSLDSSSRREAERIFGALREFGKESGLFNEILVKKLGLKATDPFQVMVTVAGTRQRRNLIDVGYGVSQALPLVVQGVLEAEYRTILMQQPEVHLHPKAQAALGSFFVNIAKGLGRRFVIETHSDFIVDRIRQEVAAGTLDCHDVIVLFFDRRGYETEVHPLLIDKHGNVTGAPSNYREFFLREELAILARSGS